MLKRAFSSLFSAFLGLYLGGCAFGEGPSPDGIYPLDVNTVYYQLSETAQQATISYKPASDSFTQENLAFAPLLEEKLLANDGLKRAFDKVFPLQNDSPPGLIFRFDLEGFFFTQRDYQLELQLRGEIFYQGDLLFKRTYPLSAISEHAEILLTGAYPWENIISEATDAALSDFLRQFLHDWRATRDVYGLPFRTSE